MDLTKKVTITLTGAEVMSAWDALTNAMNDYRERSATYGINQFAKDYNEREAERLSEISNALWSALFHNNKTA